MWISLSEDDRVCRGGAAKRKLMWRSEIFCFNNLCVIMAVHNRYRWLIVMIFSNGYANVMVRAIWVTYIGPCINRPKVIWGLWKQILVWHAWNPFQVTWIRRKDLHVLTVGMDTYVNDHRFQAIHLERSNDWALQIRYAQLTDQGLYECQVLKKSCLYSSYSFGNAN